MQAKRKVSVTVQAELLDELDRVTKGSNRSAVFEEALESWLRARRQRVLDRSIEAYYVSLGEAEQLEDAAWASLGDETFRRE